MSRATLIALVVILAVVSAAGLVVWRVANDRAEHEALNRIAAENARAERELIGAGAAP